MKPPFAKPALTYAEQLARLEERGMAVADHSEAEFYLAQLNYYRLAGYWLPFEEDHPTHRFRPGTSFRDVMNLYVFDRELRLLVLDAIERVEVSARSRWAYEMAHRHGAHGYLEPSLARNASRYTKNVTLLTEEVGRADETFIRHFLATYPDRRAWHRLRKHGIPSDVGGVSSVEGGVVSGVTSCRCSVPRPSYAPRR